MYIVWTRAQEERLSRLCADRLTSSQIADRLGVTRNAVIGKLRRMGFRLARADEKVAVKLRHMSPRPGHVQADPKPQITKAVYESSIPLPSKQAMMAGRARLARIPLRPSPIGAGG